MVGVTSLFLFISATSARHEHLEERSLASLEWNRHVNGVSIARKWGVVLSVLTAFGSTVGAVGFVLDPFLFNWYEPTAPAAPKNCQIGNGSGYDGDVSVTKMGHTCRAWGKEWEHDLGHLQNYCRNPEPSAEGARRGSVSYQLDTQGVWCYTVGVVQGKGDWDHCDVPPCPEPKPSDFGEAFLSSGTRKWGSISLGVIGVAASFGALVFQRDPFHFWSHKCNQEKGLVTNCQCESAGFCRKYEDEVCDFAKTKKCIETRPKGRSPVQYLLVFTGAVAALAGTAGIFAFWLWPETAPASGGLSVLRKAGIVVSAVTVVASVSGALLIWYWKVISKWSFSAFVDAITSRKSVRLVGSFVGGIFFVAGLTGVFVIHFDPAKMFDSATPVPTGTIAPSKILKTWLIVAAGVLANLGGWLTFISKADPFLFWPSHAGAVQISSGRKFGITVLAMTVSFSFLAVFIFQVDPFTWLTDSTGTVTAKTLAQQLGTGFSAAFGTLSVAGVLILRLDPFSWFVPKPKTKTTTTTVSTATTPGPSGVVSKESSVASEEGIELVPANNTSTTLTHTTTTQAVIGTGPVAISKPGAVTTKAPAKNTIKTKKTTKTTTTQKDMGGATTYGFTALALLLITA